MCLLSKLPPVVSDAYPCCPYRHRLCGRGGSVCCHRRTADCSQGGQSVLHSARHRTWNRNAWQHRIHDDQHLHSCEAEECRCWIHPAIKTDEPEKVFTVEQMAARICVSPYHMIRQFRAVCGLTPHQFQIQCRVRKAQRLLGEGRSVTETAYAAGFCDQSHFDRCFGKIVRLTPKEYQKCLRKQSVSTAPE